MDDGGYGVLLRLAIDRRMHESLPFATYGRNRIDRAGATGFSAAPAVCPFCGPVTNAAGSRAGRSTASVQTAGSCVTDSLRLCQLMRRLREPGKEGTMTARPEVVALITDCDVERGGVRQRFVHRFEDRRPPAGTL